AREIPDTRGERKHLREAVFVGGADRHRDGVDGQFAACDDTQTVADVVADLLARPPTNEADLERRIGPFERWEIRDALLDLIAAGDIEEGDLLGLVESFAILGLGDCRDVLESMIADPPPDASDVRRVARIAAYSICRPRRFMRSSTMPTLASSE
ncbi:MAG: hypothetical protein ABEN55_19340, partial [Bradymonadaceae bacterium]